MGAISGIGLGTDAIPSLWSCSRYQVGHAQFSWLGKKADRSGGRWRDGMRIPIEVFGELDYHKAKAFPERHVYLSG